ncbi:hypothetical protein ACFXDH_17830 [Streptomyces sp. NPDC059467]|uniref:hypothetical protein n=1 Tax=Streptomyces sp. NPDC059467 TaxID=3346844 RepID=UPI00369201A1
MKHLEFIQSSIGRLSNNSFMIKGWMMTLTSAFLGFAITQQEWEFAISALAPILGFWSLDAYFLQQERMFRALYNEVRSSVVYADEFSMDAGKYRAQTSWISTATSQTLASFYGVISLVAVTTSLLTHSLS